MSTNVAAPSFDAAFDPAKAEALPANQVVWSAARAKRIATIGFIAGIIGVGATLAGTTIIDPVQAWGSYLFAYMLFLGLALGSLFFVILHHITASRWSVTLRRIAEGSMGTLPIFALLFIPMAFGFQHLFAWMNPEIVATDALIQDKAGYLNVTFFWIRAVSYFVIWTGLAVYFGRKSSQQDKGNGVAIMGTLKAASAPGLLLFGVTLTFAAFDWLMSLSPHWFSTIFGVYYFSGAAQGMYALLIVVAMLLQRGGLLRGIVTVEHYHDLGKLLFGFTVFFAYIAFCQYFLIWYANIPEETFWFTARWENGWAPLSVAMIFFTFVIPFFWLLSRNVKRHLPALFIAAIIVLIGRVLDIYWLVLPSLDFDSVGPQFSWTTITALIGIGGMYVGMLAWRLSRNPLVPVGDPHLRSSLVHENV